jgi:hypothetical protein
MSAVLIRARHSIMAVDSVGMNMFVINQSCFSSE